MTSKRIPSLDGLRALSISLVIIGHAYQGAMGVSPPDTSTWLILGNAGLGVEIFFVISGFLITTLLLDEHTKFQTISLRNFYVRRSFRIMPALFAYIAIIWIMQSMGVLEDVTQGDILSAGIFITNYSPWANSSALAHTWSLSVEEQFYLLWPAILVILLRRPDRSAAIKVAIALIILSPTIRVLTHLSGTEFLQHHIYYMLHTRIDALMFGCLLALLSGSIYLERLYGVARTFVIPATLFIFLASPLAKAKFGGAYIYTIGYSIEGASIVLIILWVTRNAQSFVGRILNSVPLRRIGAISYSLYLWQELFLKTDLPISRHTLLAIFCIVVAAELSYRLIEQPLLRLRSRYLSST